MGTRRARGRRRGRGRGAGATLNLDPLFHPVEQVDAWLSGLLSGAPLLVALGVACLLGLRHASDPDHLVAVTSLVAAEGGGARGAARLGAWWGVGHSGTLLAVGLPLVLLKAELAGWLESGAEKAVGLVIVVLALRVLVRWSRGDFRAARTGPGAAATRPPVPVRSRRQALGIGVLHGLAGTGAVVLLLIAALPSQLQAVLALAVFAPMSVISMALCTGAFAWTLTRPAVDPVYRSLVIPALGTFGLLFGTSYAGLL